MNKVNLIGRLTKDIELKNFANGVYATFSLAINTYNKNKKEITTNFVELVAFGGNAKFLNNYVKKGELIAVEGEIITSTYVNKANIKKYSTKVRVNNVHLLESKNKKAI
ncbi:single-stranded DNA-binding protein [Clostridium sp.]|uniref:single-stranded DNA-binding protein n=1 Tax=Clostridium sp. TaxID=1506 RepID=UPI0039926556